MKLHLGVKYSELVRNIRSSSHRWKIYVFLGVCFYFVLINQFIHIRPDHVFFAMILFSFVLGKERAKRFLIDWSPFILAWIGYDMMRGVADSVRGTIHVEGPYWGEFVIFQKFFDGTIPAFFFQKFQATLNSPAFLGIERLILQPLFGGKISDAALCHFQELARGSIFRSVIDVYAANFYTAHFAAPLLMGWIFWHTVDDRKFFYRFTFTITILNIMALITFMAYPAAPPWYVMKQGFVQPNVTYDYGIFSAGALINVDNMIRVKFFTTLWDNFNSNLFAAIPSLHGAYPIVISWFGYLKFRKKPLLWAWYPISTWFSAVYLNQHYIIDLIIGGFYIIVAYQIVHRWLMPKFLNKFLDRQATQPTVMPSVT
ncbi:phosphatase PAP2 family protein [candidate division KSB1 bacterium]|nr:phosphatase PAP2 family protein [candidate division KSB1 bacterium]